LPIEIVEHIGCGLFIDIASQQFIDPLFLSRIDFYWLLDKKKTIIKYQVSDLILIMVIYHAKNLCKKTRK